RYTLDNETVSHQVKVREGVASERDSVELADPKNEHHIGSPSNGDLWVMHVRVGDLVKAGEEICNISIMKQEKSVYAQVSGVVKRVLKNANFQEDKIMVPVKEGELLVELGPVQACCPTCKVPVVSEDFKFCPSCGQKIDSGLLSLDD
ncbi:MAG: biotin/lipoyl-containing protein, partial [Humidesulfovibrio sp.]|nr:biotin/lipoyl-containing protein [Humidesulfovibrio sp.]